MLVAVGVAALARIALQAMFPNLGLFLDNRVEVTTPISSFKRLQECVFLSQHSIAPYEGDMCYHSPLLVALADILGSSTFRQNAFFALVDAVAALNLSTICKSRPKHSFDPLGAAMFYMFNPFTLASGLAKSSSSIINCLILSCLALAQTGHPAQSMAVLALASVLGWYPIFYVLPVLVLANRNTYQHFRLWKLLGVFIGSIGAFLGLSYLQSQNLEFLKMYKTQIMFTDMTRPNLGLWWYFFIELFAVFRPFFLGMFHILIGSFSIPLSVRFPDDPLFVATLTTGILTIFKPYPEVGDTGLFLSMITLNMRVVPLMKFNGVVALALLYTSALAPTFHHLWIYVGSGNANFFYAITLVYSLTLALCVCDMLWAAVRLDYDGGKSKNLMQI